MDKVTDKFNQFITKKFVVAFFVALVIKLIYAGYLFNLISCNSPELILQYFSVASGDTQSYIEPILNFFKDGSYYFRNSWGDKVYAGRMPAYGLIYYILNVISVGNGYTALVFFQIILEAFAITFFTRFLVQIGSFRLLPLLFFILMLISANQTFWSLKIQPESFATSLILILIVLFVERSILKKPLYIGVLLTLLTMLKPYLGVWFLVFNGIILFGRSQLFKEKLMVTFKLWLPFVLLIGIWTFRNYTHYQKIIPLTEPYSGYAYTKSELKMREIGGDIGLGYESWDSKSFGNYMRFPDSTYPIPSFLKESENLNELQTQRSAYQNFMDSVNILGEADNHLERNLINLQEKLKAEFPLRTSIAKPFLLTYNFLIHSGSWYYPVSISDKVCGSIVTVIDKIIQSALYYLGMLSLIPMFILLYKNRHFGLLFSSLFVCSYLILFFCFIYNFIELRFFVTAYPIQILSIGVVASFFNQRLVSNRKK